MHQDRDIADDDPMSTLAAMCDSCAVTHPLGNKEHHNSKTCPNCSANYTLKSFGSMEDHDIGVRKLSSKALRAL